ncbi:unnamed protein product, partial [Rotaria sp. Silwood2]
KIENRLDRTIELIERAAKDKLIEIDKLYSYIILSI